MDQRVARIGKTNRAQVTIPLASDTLLNRIQSVPLA